MKTLFLLFIHAVVVSNVFSFPPLADKHINTAREQIVNVSRVLSSGGRPAMTSLATLRSTLDSIESNYIVSSADKLTLQTVSQSRMLALDSTLRRFVKLQSLNLSSDSLHSLFLQVATTFEFIFCDYFHEQAKESASKKVFLFSISVSCECTLKMCGEYLEALYASQQRYNNSLDIIVFDTFDKTDLKDRYNIEFIPTLIVLDENNNEIHRFVREEQIAEKLIPILE